MIVPKIIFFIRRQFQRSWTTSCSIWAYFWPLILGDKGPKLVENDLEKPFHVLEIIIHGVVNARLRGLNKLLVLCGECFKSRWPIEDESNARTELSSKDFWTIFGNGDKLFDCPKFWLDICVFLFWTLSTIFLFMCSIISSWFCAYDTFFSMSHLFIWLIGSKM